MALAWPNEGTPGLFRDDHGQCRWTEIWPLTWGYALLAGTTSFRAALATRSITHVRIPARSPNHNAVVERFQGTMLQECWRPAFHRRRFMSSRQLQAEADAWLSTYNNRRRNHGAYMAGRTPADVLDKHRKRRAA